MYHQNLSVAVLGCGWLGLPFASHAIEKGWRVKGSTTSYEKLDVLKESGIEGYILKLPSQDNLLQPLFDVDALLLNIPPGRANPKLVESYPEQVELIMQKAAENKKLKHALFVSSTSVYGPEGDIISEATEADPVSASGRAVLRAENIVRASGIPSVILRFGGLIGPGRHPGNFLSGKSGIRTGQQAVNMLHLSDAVHVIAYMFAHRVVGQIFNVVAPIHPPKKDFYTKMARQLNVPIPGFEDNQEVNRREISVDKLITETGFKFTFPDPMNFTFH